MTRAKAKPSTKAQKKTALVPVEQSAKRPLIPHELVLFPSVQGAIVADAWGKKFAGEMDLSALSEGLHNQIQKVQDGDMGRVESMLYSQAVALQTIFTSLARRATMQEYLKHEVAYLGLAMKAQAQSRATLEALAEVKNPRSVAFVKQANIAQGPQQVNNGTMPGHPVSRAEESDIEQNKLLEHQHANTLGTGAQGTAGGVDSALETVGTVHRAA